MTLAVTMALLVLAVLGQRADRADRMADPGAQEDHDLRVCDTCVNACEAGLGTSVAEVHETSQDVVERRLRRTVAVHHQGTAGVSVAGIHARASSTRTDHAWG